MREVICDMENDELKSLLKSLKNLVLSDVSKGGRRVVSVGGDGHSLTYDLGPLKPQAVYRLVRSELVRRGCLKPKPKQILCLDMGNHCRPKCEDSSCGGKGNCNCGKS